MGFLGFLKLDGFVKSPTAALRFIFRHCGVPVSRPHSSRFASLAFGAFTLPSQFWLPSNSNLQRRCKCFIFFDIW